MFDISTVQTSYLSLIDWRESVDTEMPKLSSALKVSESGLCYNDSHPLVSIENIEAIAPNYDSMPATAWAVGTTYAKDSIVRYDTVIYVSLQAGNVGKTPSANPTWWLPMLSTYIENLTKASIVNMLYRFIDEKQLSNATKSIMEDTRLFDGEGRVTTTEVAQGRFVGYEFKIKDYTGLQLAIKRIGGQFTQVQTGLKIYLFHSSQSGAVLTYTMTTTKSNSMEWFVPTTAIEMNFAKYSKIDAGGAWYLGYFEDDLTGQAIQREVDLTVEPCGTCLKDTYNLYSYRLRDRYFKFTPVSFASSYLNGVSLPDMEGVNYATENWGLNLAITVTCDLTDFFIDNRKSFARLLWKQVAADVLKAIAFSTRMDGTSKSIKNDAYLEIKGDPSKNYQSGIEYELSKEYKSMALGINDLNTPCMNKHSKGGIRIGSI
jgi:hypothetical protein